MNDSEVQQALQTMITYFESGTRESDEAAKTILLSDADYWQEKIEDFQASVEWTGLRAPEAEVLALALRTLR